MKAKKFISILLSVVMVLSLVPMTEIASLAATSGDYTYTVLSETDKTCEITEYTGSATELTIPSTLDGYTVKSIGRYAFSRCTSLTSITIPDSVTSIGDYAFYCCTSLTSITIPDSVTSIGDDAFYFCISLTSIDVSENNANYCSVDGILFNKDKTELVCYPAGKTDTSYTIPDSVTSIGDCAFEYCKSLTSITIPDSVTSIGNLAFSYCESLTSITIPDSVTSIGSLAFENCTSLTSITIPDSVTSIGSEAFEDCSSLTSVTIPDSVTSIGSRAFEGCTSLTDVYYSGSEEDWNNISIGRYNPYLKNAAIHYNSSKISDTATDVPTLTITSSQKDLTAGANIAISVVLSENSGLTGLQFVLKYDPQAVEYVAGSATCGGLWSYEVLSDSHSGRINFAAVQTKALKDGGAIFTANFKVLKADAEFSGYVSEAVDENDEAQNVNVIIFECEHPNVREQIKKEASCAEDGLKIIKCSVCGETLETKTIPATGHTYGEWKTTTAATCTENGTQKRTCSTCGATLETKTIPATGHTYGAWKVTTAATATKNGVETRTCSVCGNKETRSIAALGYIQMYRLYNPNSGEHFYTANSYERDNLVSLGWDYEGIGWNAPKSSSTPVYRLYNSQGGEHHYTTNAAEKDNLVKLGWSYEGIGWYSDDNKGVALYRQYNPNAYANNHNYTTNLGENNYLVSLGWQAEGIGWYGVA